jgi:uncharacterized protein (TIGR03435 family)
VASHTNSQSILLRRLRVLVSLLALVNLVPRCTAQSPQPSPLAFDVASIKPNKSGGHTTRRIEPGSITVVDITLGEFIRMAYSLSNHQLSGPDWIIGSASTDRYDIIAKAAGPTSQQEMMLMLRTLLVERFHLTFHQETRDAPVYALTIAKSGPKLAPGDGGVKTTAKEADGRFDYKNWTMTDFANSLALIPAVGRPVIDHTGLTGAYSFKANLFELPTDVGKEGIGVGDALFSTLQDQLGLKLEPRKEPLEFLIIDHADKLPVDN